MGFVSSFFKIGKASDMDYFMINTIKIMANYLAGLLMKRFHHLTSVAVNATMCLFIGRVNSVRKCHPLNVLAINTNPINIVPSFKHCIKNKW